MKSQARAGRIAFVIAVLLIGAGALWLRLSHLDVRPMHSDEAVHALKLRDLMQGNYRYDPYEFHGPTLYYFTLPLLWLRGASDIAAINESTLRTVPALFGAGLILLLLLVRDAVRAPAVLCAAILTAVSPAMSYYARYYIQETLLVFFSFAFMACLWRYGRSGKNGWCLLAGACLGLMHATKETWVLSVLAMLPALLLATWWTRRLERRELLWPRHVKARTLLAGLATALLVSMLCYSTFGRNPQGVVDSVRAYAVYLGRGSGDSIHVHPWNYYLNILAYFKNGPGPWWSEGLVLVLFVVGTVFSLWLRKPHSTVGEETASHDNENPMLARFLVFYSIILCVLYSLLPYKTPWCLLGFWQTAIVVAGIGAFAFVRAMPGRILKVAMSLMLLGATWQLNNQALSANDRFRADRRNPYVYAHSSTDVADFGKQMEEIAASTREGHKMLVVVVAPDAWPLPWYLRRFENVGFWNDPTDPALKNALRNATVVLAAAELQPQIQSQLRTLVPQHAFNEQTRSLRPTVFFVANVRSDAWNAFMARR